MTPRHATMGIPFVAAKDGIRQSTASVYLPNAMSRPNFTLALQSTVTAILHDGQGRALGVKFSHEGVEKTAELQGNGILVMAAGALGTPKLLMESGVVKNNFALGQRVSDHTYMLDKYKVPTGAIRQTINYQDPSMSIKLQYNEKRSGSLGQFGPTLTTFLKSPQSPHESDAFDVEAWVAPTDEMSSLAVHFSLMRPTCSYSELLHTSEGAFTLRENFTHGIHLKCERDRQTMQAARQQIQDAMWSQGARRMDGSSRGPYDMNHWAGSCALDHCVDRDSLIVHGSRNVAVADASLLPHQVWGHPAHTLRAVALKAADILAPIIQ